MGKEQELRPCKACGQPEGHIAANGGWLWGECWNCDYRTSFHRSSDEAQTEWNRRSSSDEQAEVVGDAEPFLTGRGWENLSCDDQFSLATQIAANVGYELVAEPEHPDSPHNRAHDLASPVAMGGVTDLLAEMAKHPGWSIERGYRDRGGDEDDPYGWCVHEVRGGHNDREWDLIGFGDTPHAALTAALSPPGKGLDHIPDASKLVLPALPPGKGDGQ
jgi:hypothetical protein